MSRAYRGKPTGEGGGMNPASPPLQPTQDRAYIRLELLRLAHRPDRTEQDIIDRAELLEAWVVSEPAADKF